MCTVLIPHIDKINHSKLVQVAISFDFKQTHYCLQPQTGERKLNNRVSHNVCKESMQRAVPCMACIDNTVWFLEMHGQLIFNHIIHYYPRTSVQHMLGNYTSN